MESHGLKFCRGLGLVPAGDHRLVGDEPLELRPPEPLIKLRLRVRVSGPEPDHQVMGAVFQLSPGRLDVPEDVAGDLAIFRWMSRGEARSVETVKLSSPWMPTPEANPMMLRLFQSDEFR